MIVGAAMAIGDENRLHDSIISCCPAARHMATWPLSLLAPQRSYRQRKSSLVTEADIGGGSGSILALALSRTMLAQEGAALESNGSAGAVGSNWWVSPTPPPLRVSHLPQ